MCSSDLVLYQAGASWYTDTSFVALNAIYFRSMLHYKIWSFARKKPLEVLYGTQLWSETHTLLLYCATAVYSTYKAIKIEHQIRPQTPVSQALLKHIACYYHPEEVHGAQSNYIILRNQFPLLHTTEHEQERQRYETQERIREELRTGTWKNPVEQLPLPKLLQLYLK